MTAAALAICGAAWLGGIAVVASAGAVAVKLPGRAAVVVSLPAIGTLAALAAAPLLLLAMPGEASGAAAIPAAAVGVAAAAVGALVVMRTSAASVVGAGRVAPRPALGGIAPALASAAIAIAIGLGVGGALDALAADGFPRAAAFAAGVALVAAAVPSMLLGTGRARRESLAVGVAGGSLAGAGLAGAGLAGVTLGTAPGLLAVAGSVLATLALVAGTAVAPASLNRRGMAVAAAVAAVVPLVVGVVGIALLWTETSSAVGTGVPAGRAALVLAIVGGLGAALLALAERGFHPRRNAIPLLAPAASVPVAALALAVTDAVTACLVAATASAAARAIRPEDADPAPDETAVVVGSAVLASLALATAAFSGGTPGAAPTAGLAGLAVATAVALRFGSIPFHRSTIATADRTPSGTGSLMIGWLAAVFAFAALGGIAAATATISRPLDAGGTALVAFVAVITIVLGGIASLVQERLVHALAYLVAAQSGWAVLVVIAPAAAWPAASAWLPAFAAASLALGGVALVADRGTGSTRVGDLGRTPGAAAIELVALVGAGLALPGLPGLAGWAARAAIGRAAFGEGPAADALLAVGAIVTVAALGRLVARAVSPLSRARSWRLEPSSRPVGRSGWRADRRSLPIDAVTSPNAIGLAAVGLLALLAAAVGLGLVA
ncbi:MAG TPA: hypothetical protein VFS32_04215 [Candidatus Limnocylindrales bacterium]|nr:hypothetical protein [Candidatus Limnocylindrales bacterium]